jgi:NADP-dependent 3-hydroxy acid dehydrogenase YdfG
MMARALVSAGAARVYIVGRRVDVLQAAAASINRPSVVVPLYCDVTSKVSLESIVSVVETDVGCLDLLVWYVLFVWFVRLVCFRGGGVMRPWVVTLPG